MQKQENRVVLKGVSLSKKFGGDSPMTYAISNCSLEVREGEFVAITGERGSGKSTLLHLLGGFEKPNRGRVFLNTRDLYSLNNTQMEDIYKNDMGFIFQRNHLISRLTLQENILMPALLNHNRVDQGYFHQLTDILQITKLLNRYPKELPEKLKHYAAIGRVLINKPKIVIADEPTANLEQQEKYIVVKLFLDYIREQGGTVVMATRDKVAIQHADQVIRIKDGCMRGIREKELQCL